MDITANIKKVISTPSHIFSVEKALYCIGSEGDTTVPIAVSSDFGKTWAVHGNAPNASRYMSSVVRHRGSTMVYLFTSSARKTDQVRVYLSTDMKHWEFKSVVKSEINVIVALPGRLFTINENALYLSVDDGRTWTSHSQPPFMVRSLFTCDARLCCLTSDSEMKAYDGVNWENIFENSVEQSSSHKFCVWDALSYRLISCSGYGIQQCVWGSHEWTSLPKVDSYQLYPFNIASCGCDLFAIDRDMHLFIRPGDIKPLLKHSRYIRQLCSSLGDMLLPELVESYILPFLYPLNGYITELNGPEAENYAKVRHAKLRTIRSGFWTREAKLLQTKRNRIDKSLADLDRQRKHLEGRREAINEQMVQPNESCKRARTAWKDLAL